MDRIPGNTMRNNAFTLIELLVAIAILVVLAGMGLVIYDTVATRSKNAQCTAWMAKIGTCLSSFKEDDGDYPYTPGFVDFGATTAAAGLPQATPPGNPPPSGFTTAYRGNYLAIASFERTDAYKWSAPVTSANAALKTAIYDSNTYLKDVNISSSAISASTINDPWGNPFVYIFKGSSAGWPSGITTPKVEARNSYILFSAGGDGMFAVAAHNGTNNRPNIISPDTTASIVFGGSDLGLAENTDNVWFSRKDIF